LVPIVRQSAQSSADSAHLTSAVELQVLSVVSTNEEIPTVLKYADDDLLSGNIVKLLCSHTYVR